MDQSTEVRTRAAAAHGIELAYIDIWGNTHQTPDDVVDAILKSFSSEPEPRPLPSTVVIRQHEDSLALRTPETGALKLEIQWEGGEIESHSLPEIATTDGVRRVPLPPLRLGYHQLRIYRDSLALLVESHFIVCPARGLTFDSRAAGVAVSLYGLRSQRNWGCGDFTDLHAAIDSFARAGCAFIALNPLHAIPNRQPYNTSPYLPQCSLYRNFLYLDVERTGSLTLTTAEIQEIELLRTSEFVEYERVASLKLAVLTRVFAAFPGSPDFDAYITEQGQHLQDFAVYCALDAEMHRRDPNIWLWTDWPAQFHDPRSPAVAEFAREHHRDVLFYKFLQWHIDRQLAEAQAHALAVGMKIGIYHDLALATDRFGADLWANGAFYVKGSRVGSPPDDFSPNGQDWAFPPPNRDVHRDNGYQLFAQSIRNNARRGGALRIDHVMRFFRLYWIPDGRQADSGAYVQDYADDLLGVLALESQRGNFIVIGEDLGTVTGEVRRRLADTGILGYRIFWFERDGAGNFRRPEEYPAHAVVSTTTHDLPTLAGFASGRDIEARRAAGLIDEEAYRAQHAARDQEKVHLDSILRDTGFPNDPIDFLLSTPCTLAVVNQEDLTGETEQQNLPGSTWQYPNWRRKMKIPVEDFAAIETRLAQAIARSSRS
ncbi:MAG: 4-alpha-glucanotransferase [Bryobacteraceae bacterium]